MAGVTGIPGEAAAKPAVLEDRRGRGSVTARPQGRGETRAAGTGLRLETATLMHAQSMEVGDPGAPMALAAELAEEAHREDIDLATTPVQQMEAHLVLDALAELVQEAVLLLPQKQDPVTRTPAPETAAPTPTTGHAAHPPTAAMKERETATVTACRDKI